MDEQLADYLGWMAIAIVVYSSIILIMLVLIGLKLSSITKMLSQNKGQMEGFNDG